MTHLPFPSSSKTDNECKFPCSVRDLEYMWPFVWLVAERFVRGIPSTVGHICFDYSSEWCGKISESFSKIVGELEFIRRQVKQYDQLLDFNKVPRNAENRIDPTIWAKSPHMKSLSICRSRAFRFNTEFLAFCRACTATSFARRAINRCAKHTFFATIVSF